MSIAFCSHAMKKTEFVRHAGEVWKQVRHHFPALAARTEFPQRLGQGSLLALKGHQFVATRQWLPSSLEQFWLVIKGVEVA